MKQNDKHQVESFLAQKHIAVVGYSRNPQKFGYQVFDMLKTKGYQVYPVNPTGGLTPSGEQIFSSVAALPEQVKAALFAVKPDITNLIIKEASEKKLTHIWVQQMSENMATMEVLKQSQVMYVVKRCIFMHANPSGFHKFHRWLVGLFGRLPK